MEPIIDYKHMGQRLKEQREAHGLTQGQLEKAKPATLRAISGIEAAKIITEDLQALPVQVIDTRPHVLLELSRVHGYRKDFNDLLTIEGKGVFLFCTLILFNNV